MITTYNYNFQIFLEGNNQVILPIPEELMKTKNLIYAIVEKDESDKENRMEIDQAENQSLLSENIKYLYIGKTGQDLPNRLHVHKSKIKHVKNDDSGLYLYLKKGLKKDEKSFEVRIIDRASDVDELNRKEIAAIQKFNPTFNENSGGGGGNVVAYDPLQSPLKTSSGIKVEFPSPKKKYPIQKTEDVFSILLTPHGAKKSHLVYAVVNVKNGDTLIGETELTLKERMSGYKSEINHSIKDLYTCIRENPDEWAVEILYEVPLNENPKEAEVYFIQKFKELHPERRLLNLNKGGGGGYSAKRKLFKESFI